MQISRREMMQAGGLTVLGALSLSGCDGSGGPGASTSTSSGGASSTTPAAGGLPKAVDRRAWRYDADHDVYYQLSCTYVAKPQAPELETLAVLVPGRYLHGTPNGDGTYTVSVDGSGTVGGHTAQTAPIAMPVDTPGYAGQRPMNSYSYDDAAELLEAGLVYVHAGVRGQDTQSSSYTGNAPWGVVDLKSAVRFLRYSSETVPGDKDAIYVFGHSGGGAQSAIMGASGDSELYAPYLTALGAVMVDARGHKVSDAVAGAMCWCPITTLDWADAAYEWNMGQFATTGTRADGTWTKKYSSDLAEAFAGYQSSLGLKDSAGKELTLTRSDSGTYLAGSYYDHLVKVVEDSLNAFLGYTTFPYTPDDTQSAGMGGAEGANPSGSGASFASVDAYLAHLNEETEWVTYDPSSRKATVTNLAGFVRSQKKPTKDVGAFDGVDRGALENVVMGLGTGRLHFSRPSADVVKAHQATYDGLPGWQSGEEAAQYDGDLARTDGVGTGVPRRVDMYNPLYYLARSSKGFGTSTVSPHWRIRTGIMQGDTASTTEVNLALALENLGGRTVDFATVWGRGHVPAETTGTPTTNFVAWVKKMRG